MTFASAPEKTICGKKSLTGGGEKKSLPTRINDSKNWGRRISFSALISQTFRTGERK